MSEPSLPPDDLWTRALRFFLEAKLVVFIAVGVLFFAGLSAAPFDWNLGGLPRDPIPVDALPDISDNQQIVFTKWPGRSPRDVEDQVTYPLTSALLAIPKVKSVRSASMFGFSSIYVIFEDEAEFYWSRSRVLEKLASLPPGTLPSGVSPTLGPDATALGQVFWYTLEARDAEDRPVAGAFDLHELRSIQDWNLRFALSAVDGVAEVSSIGGHVREYQVEVDPEALLAHGVTIGQVAHAVGRANLDVSARTLEINRAEYVVRGLGFVEDPADLEQVVVAVRSHTPIRVRDVAHVSFGPAGRRGALDDAGAPAVGGVVVVRFGGNALSVIDAVKERLAEIAPGLPRRTLEDGSVAQVQVVPFYDRTALIHETLGTLADALTQELLVTVLVVLIVLRRFRASLIISVLLPLGVLGAFVAMRRAGVDANVMALAGIAIAIGTMVDMGIVFTENMTRHLDAAPPGSSPAEAIIRGAREVSGAVFTSVATTVVSFVPVFGLTAAEGKLFTPLAYTKTFALLSAFVVAVVLLPPLAGLVLRRASTADSDRRVKLGENALLALVVALVLVSLSRSWMPLGPEAGTLGNTVGVAALVGLLMAGFLAFARLYRPSLAWCLEHKAPFIVANLALVGLGLTAWLGASAWLPAGLASSAPGRFLSSTFPGAESDFMPPFDEGSFLYMPTTTPHASLGQAIDMLQDLDAAIAQVPEVDRVVGKLGRAESPLDPAPVSMIETLVTYHPEYRPGRDGEPGLFRYDEDAGAFARDERGDPIEDSDGRPYRQWRDHIHGPDDIWHEIAEAGRAPGLTGAPQLMPIKTRIVMLQSGMRAPVGIKIKGPDLASLEAFALDVERLLRRVDVVDADSVVADRIVGKPYLELDIDREAIARHGLTIEDVQDVIQLAVGGKMVTQTVEGRERYPVRVRYMREERDSVEALRRVMVAGREGEQVPLQQLVELRYVRGPQVIKSEESFLTAYVTFAGRASVGEVATAKAAAAAIEEAIEGGSLSVPEGVSYRLAGTYENQLRSQARLQVLLPLSLAVIFVLLYLQFRRASTALIVFCGVALAATGGFLLLWAYGKPWFLAVSPLGIDLRELLGVRETRLTVAVWVGFIALFGVAIDNGVVLATYLAQRFAATRPSTSEAVAQTALEAGELRLRPCLMTTATTMLALLPVITSTGRGADLMAPMALPTLGGIGMGLLTLFTVPVLYAALEERAIRRQAGPTPPGEAQSA